MSERSASRSTARGVVAAFLGVAVALHGSGCGKGDSEPPARSPEASSGSFPSEGPSAQPPESRPPVSPDANRLFRETTQAVGRSILCMLDNRLSGAKARGTSYYGNVDALDGPDGRAGTADDLRQLVVLQAQNTEGRELFLEASIRGTGNPQVRVSTIQRLPTVVEPPAPRLVGPVLASPATEAVDGGFSNDIVSNIMSISNRTGGLMASGPGLPDRPATPADLNMWSRELIAYTSLTARAAGIPGCTPEQPAPMSEIPAPASASPTLPPDARV